MSFHARRLGACKAPATSASSMQHVVCQGFRTTLWKRMQKAEASSRNRIWPLRFERPDGQHRCNVFQTITIQVPVELLQSPMADAAAW